MPTLVAVNSVHGSTHEIAQRVVEVLRETKGVNAVLVELSNAQQYLDDVDAVVVAAPIYNGEWDKEAHRFVMANQAELANKSLFILASGIEPVLAGPAADVIQSLGAREVGYFTGRIDPQKLSVLEKTSVDEEQYGDFRDWPAIEAWAKDISTHGAV